MGQTLPAEYGQSRRVCGHRDWNNRVVDRAGLELMRRDGQGREYFPFTFALLCSGALYRLIHVWWVRPEKPEAS